MKESSHLVSVLWGMGLGTVPYAPDAATASAGPSVPGSEDAAK